MIDTLEMVIWITFCTTLGVVVGVLAHSLVASLRLDRAAKAADDAARPQALQ